MVLKFRGVYTLAMFIFSTYTLAELGLHASQPSGMLTYQGYTLPNLDLHASQTSKFLIKVDLMHESKY